MSHVHLSFIHPSCPIRFENQKTPLSAFWLSGVKKSTQPHSIFFGKSVSFSVHSTMSLLCSLAFCHSGGAPVDYRWQHFFATEQNGWGILPRGLRQKIASCSPGQCFQTAPDSYHFKFYSAISLKKAHNLILATHKYYIKDLKFGGES